MRLRPALVELFKTTNLYKLFEIDKGATEREVKKAFYKLCQRYHPDKVAEAEREKATKQFQAVNAVYELLIDPKRREIYDKSGEIVDGNEAISTDIDWEAYVAQFKRVTADEIAEFAASYKNSEEERADLRAAYERFQGDLDKVMETVPLAEVLEDESRFRSILDDLIKRGQLPAFDAYVKEPEAKRKKRHDRALRERRRFEKHVAVAKRDEPTQPKGDAPSTSASNSTKRRTSAVSDEQSLVALIQSRNRSCFDGAFLDSLAEKYSGKSKTKAASSNKRASRKGDVDGDGDADQISAGKRRVSAKARKLIESSSESEREDSDSDEYHTSPTTATSKESSKRPKSAAAKSEKLKSRR